jgi:predicted enzyme involved in methoxymalonyl-ACP biosynthesis
LLAAKQGRSRKCLVLDLDNTLWGGVIGDDGLGASSLGQGSGLGEAFHAVETLCVQGAICLGES